MKIHKEVIDYIENRLSEQPYEGRWVTLEGKEIGADLGYVQEWWNNCMKPELEEVFNQKEERANNSSYYQKYGFDF